MCGITGFLNQENALEKAEKAIGIMHNRGIDNQAVVELPFGVLGHLLHSVVGSVKQPLQGKGFFSSNCEIYNWKKLCKKHSIAAVNDSDLLFRLLEKNWPNVKPVLEEFDGTWAFAYCRDNIVVLGRDIFGVKPLWFSPANGFSFASEKKALEAAGCIDIVELDPRHVLFFDLKKNTAKFLKRKFLAAKESKLSFDESKKKLLSLFRQAVEKRVPEKKFGLLFSGGIDSVLLALVLKRMKLDFKCFFAFAEGLGNPKDLEFALKSAEVLGLEFETVPVHISVLEGVLKELVPLIESSNPVKVGVALPLFLACQQARKSGIKVIFSGLGADELFCGYSRLLQSNNVALDSINLLLQMHENDLYRDDVLSMNNNLELRLPFLDLSLAEFAVSLPKKFKLSGAQNKIILRSIALDLGLSEELAERKKTAAQYGSNFDRALEKLAKSSKAKGKAGFLQGFANKKNLKIAALFSGGKDSCLALWIMQRQNYDVKCLVSIVPKNRDSFMFHKPDESFLKLQSEALDIPLVVEKTFGEKEKELAALKKALLRAKKIFGIEGVVSGALYSNYQRERIRKICTLLGLKLFSPLWHKKQMDELNELVDNGFVFAMSKVAGLGLDSGWLGKIIGKKEIALLGALEKKLGFNAAGEGGEFESVVLDAPNFSRAIEIIESKKIMVNDFSGFLEIKKAVLGKKP